MHQIANFKQKFEEFEKNEKAFQTKETEIAAFTHNQIEGTLSKSMLNNYFAECKNLENNNEGVINFKKMFKKIDSVIDSTNLFELTGTDENGIQVKKLNVEYDFSGKDIDSLPVFLDIEEKNINPSVCVLVSGRH